MIFHFEKYIVLFYIFRSTTAPLALIRNPFLSVIQSSLSCSSHLKLLAIEFLFLSLFGGRVLDPGMPFPDLFVIFSLFLIVSDRLCFRFGFGTASPNVLEGPGLTRCLVFDDEFLLFTESGWTCILFLVASFLYFFTIRPVRLSRFVIFALVPKQWRALGKAVIGKL